MVLKECCSKCGLPTEIQRVPVILDNNILSFLEYEENTCEECGHQIDGSTLPEVHKIIQEMANKFINDREKLIKFLNKFNFMTQEERKEVCLFMPRFMNPKYDKSKDDGDFEEPYSWNVVYLEVLNDTQLSRVMLREIKWEDKDGD